MASIPYRAMLRSVLAIICLVVITSKMASGVECYGGTWVLGVHFGNSTSFGCASCYTYELMLGTVLSGCQGTSCDEGSFYSNYSGYSCCEIDLCNSATTTTIRAGFIVFVTALATAYPLM